MLAEFRDSESLASCIRGVLDNPLQKKEMEMKTLDIGKEMTWAKVARRYTKLFANILEGPKPGRVQRFIRINEGSKPKGVLAE